MIRFVIRRRLRDRYTSLETVDLETIDCDVPLLERVLLGGGHDSGGGYDHRELLGAEVLHSTDTAGQDVTRHG